MFVTTDAGAMCFSEKQQKSHCISCELHPKS